MVRAAVHIFSLILLVAWLTGSGFVADYDVDAAAVALQTREPTVQDVVKIECFAITTRVVVEKLADAPKKGWYGESTTMTCKIGT